MQITIKNYRTHLLNQAVRTQDLELANLAKTATLTTLKNLYAKNYKLPVQPVAAAQN